jgi:hypothetical protein
MISYPQVFDDDGQGLGDTRRESFRYSARDNGTHTKKGAAMRMPSALVTPNPDGTPMLDPTPWVGQVPPFLIESLSQFRTDGPQALSSAAWALQRGQNARLGE